MPAYEIKKGFGVFISPTLICDADGKVLYRLVYPWFGWSRKILNGSKTCIGTVRNRPWRPLEIQHDEYGVATFDRVSFWGSLYELTLPEGTQIEVRSKWRQTQFIENGEQIATAKVKFWARERTYCIEVGNQARDFYILITAALQGRFGGGDSSGGE